MGSQAGARTAVGEAVAPLVEPLVAPPLVAPPPAALVPVAPRR